MKLFERKNAMKYVKRSDLRHVEYLTKRELRQELIYMRKIDLLFKLTIMFKSQRGFLSKLNLDMVTIAQLEDMVCEKGRRKEDDKPNEKI